MFVINRDAKTYDPVLNLLDDEDFGYIVDAVVYKAVSRLQLCDETGEILEDAHLTVNEVFQAFDRKQAIGVSRLIVTALRSKVELIRDANPRDGALIGLFIAYGEVYATYTAGEERYAEAVALDAAIDFAGKFRTMDDGTGSDAGNVLEAWVRAEILHIEPRMGPTLKTFSYRIRDR